MDSVAICATPLWNESISWNTKDPYFNECFKNLILVIASCAVLWVVAPIEFIKICRYHGTPSPWTKLSITKISLKAILLLICLIELVKETYAYVTGMTTGLDGLIAAVAYLVTIILTVVITMMCKKRGLRSSFALPSFWMISTIATLVSIYDDIHDVDVNDWISIISLVDDSLSFFLSLIQLILSCIADKEIILAGRQFEKYCPLEGSGFPSRLTFSWLLKLIAKSADNSLHQDYLIPQCHELKSATVVRKFNEIWKGNLRNNTGQQPVPDETRRLLNNEMIQSQERRDILPNFANQRKRSLLKTLMKTSKKYLMISSILEIVFTALYFLPTYLLSLILSSGKEPEWHKYLFATTLFIVLLFRSFADSQRKYFGLVAALRIKTAVMNAVFEKALVSQETQDVKEHLHEDAENVFQMVCLATEFWGAPLRLLIGFYLLYLFLGPACFAGFATAALLIPLNVMTAAATSNFQEKSSEVKNDRLNVLSQTLRGMKLLKIYAWEEFFLQKLSSLRKSELKPLRIAMFLKMSSKFLVLSSTSLVALTTFLVYVLMANPVDGRVIFVSFSLIYLLKTPFASLLRLFAYFVQGLVSMSRIQSFLEAKEMENLPQGDSGCEILLEEASFTWAEGETPFLKNLDFKARDGYLIAVMGDSSSGKSSFLRALLGQMKNVSGIAQVKGEIAYVGDSAWIQNTTLEKNILFVKPKNEDFYKKTLQVTELESDIEILPQGEETEIGEKGYQLNEDQKLKVDLARAIYQDADIYLLDDPLRCSDESISERLYFRVIGHGGILRRKVRIFTTTDDRFLSLVDQILFLKDGRIIERGKFSQLIAKNGYFAKYSRKMSDSCISEGKNNKISKSNFSFTDNFKDHCDPWYSASGVFFKPEVESLMHGETTDAPIGLFLKLLHFMKMKGYILTILSVFLAIIAGCFEVAGWVWWTRWTHENTNPHKVYKKIYIYASFVLVQAVSTALCGVLIYSGATFAVQRLYSWSLNRIMRAPQSTFGTTFIEKVSRSFDKDLQYADDQIPFVFYIWLIAVMKAPILLLVIFIKSPIVIVFSAPLILAFCVVLKLYMNTWQQLHRLTAATRCPLSNLLKEMLQGIMNIRAYKANAHFITRFQVKLDTYNNCYLLFLLVSRWLSSSIEIIGSFFVLLAASVILYEEPNGYHFAGIFIVFAMEISEILTALTYMSSLLDFDLSAIERFQSFTQIKQEAEWENPAYDLPDLWPSSGSILINNLGTTAYGEGLYPVINNINLSIEHGEKVAIVGKESSGIYTILDSLSRIREISKEQIYIDHIDISNIGLHGLRSRLAFLPRDHFVFSGTIRENLDPNEDYQDEQLRLVMRTVSLTSHFTELNEVVGEKIRPEDKYKFSLARCILKKPKLVIVDEPEEMGYENLFKDCTFLTFGENPVVDKYSRIIYISYGEIVKEVIPKPPASFR